MREFEKGLLEYFSGPCKELRDTLVESRSFKGGLEEKFLTAIKDFKSSWSRGD